MSAVRDHEQAQQHLNRGIERRQANDLEGALAAYTAALQADPKNVEAYNNRGNVYSFLEKYDRAIADFTEAIRLDPNNALAYHHRGIEKELKGDLDGAIADYKTALSLQSDVHMLANTHTNLGTLYETFGDHQNAISSFNEAVRLDPHHILALYKRGFAHERAGNFERAVIDYRQVLQLDPDHAQSRYMQAVIDTVEHLQAELKKRLSHYTGDIDKAAAELWPLLAKALEGVQLNSTTPDPYALLDNETVISLHNQLLADDDAASTERQRTGHGD